jgi:hypothetical protein
VVSEVVAPVVVVVLESDVSVASPEALMDAEPVPVSSTVPADVLVPVSLSVAVIDADADADALADACPASSSPHPTVPKQAMKTQR